MSDLLPAPQRCQAIRVDGSPCTAKAIGSTDRCLGHAEGARAWRQKGGRSTSWIETVRRVLPTELRGVLAELERTFKLLGTGEIAPAAAQAQASVAKAILEVWKTAEFEVRIRRIEETTATKSEGNTTPRRAS